MPAALEGLPAESCAGLWLHVSPAVTVLRRPPCGGVAGDTVRPAGGRWGGSICGEPGGSLLNEPKQSDRVTLILISTKQD